MKISILLSISKDAPVPFLQILPSISHETTVSSFQLFYGVFQFKNSLILLDIVICKGNYFQRKRKRGPQSVLYRLSQNRLSVRHPIQSEKYGDAKSYMSTGFVPYFKDNYYE